MIAYASAETILLDTNLAVLLVANRTPGLQLSSFKNARQFDASDARLLEQLLETAAAVLTLPFIVAEVSNLLAQGHGKRARLSTLAASLGRWDEATVASSKVGQHPAFPHLGATDCAILYALERTRRASLLTTDLTLHLTALSAGFRSLNFNEFRDDSLSD